MSVRGAHNQSMCRRFGWPRIYTPLHPYADSHSTQEDEVKYIYGSLEDYRLFVPDCLVSDMRQKGSDTSLGARNGQEMISDKIPDSKNHGKSIKQQSLFVDAGSFSNFMGWNEMSPIRFPQYVGWGVYRAGDFKPGTLGYKAQLGGRGARFGSFTRATRSNAGRSTHGRYGGYGRVTTVSPNSPRSFTRGTRWTVDYDYIPWMDGTAYQARASPNLDLVVRANPAPPSPPEPITDFNTY